MSRETASAIAWRLTQRLDPISYEDRLALVRCERILHSWAERECNGDIERDDEGRAYACYGGDAAPRQRVRTADREAGALRRIAAVIARYPGFSYYHQGDPRGCALYILRPGDVPAGVDADACYSRGVAVC